MDGVIFGLLAIVLGAIVCFFGLWFFAITLPIYGFIGGFTLGAAGMAALLGQGFLGTSTGIIVGIVVGLIFAVLSYFFWYFGVIFAAASVGALIGTGLMSALGLTANWWLVIVAIVFGAVFALGALVLNLPPYLVLVNTALVGSAAIVTGLLLVFQRIPVAELANGPAWAAVKHGWIWWVLWIAIAVAGMLSQLRKVDEIAAQLPNDKWVPANA